MSAAFTALILAAGEGTRMRSARPKGLHDLCGRPLACWPVQAALDAHAGNVVVVQSPARALDAVLPDAVCSVVQQEANGTGGAVLAAASQIEPGAPVVILSGDVPLVGAEVIEQLLDAHAASAAGATILTTVLADPAGYGRVVRDAEGFVARVVETKAAGDASPQELEIDEVNAGVYAFDGKVLLEALPGLTAENAQRELYITQALERVRTAAGKVAALTVADAGVALGVNDRAQLATVRALAQSAINERHMREGVTIVDPASTYIDVGVTIGEDTTIHPGTRLLGRTVVGSDAVLGPQCTAIDSEVGDRAVVRVAWLDQASVHAGATVGPFTHLRPGTVMHEGSKAGAFVEIKKSDIGAGAKVPHLSYIGDADVGEETNLGAATITANYDGQAKHRTKIGKRVRSGVDTTFVAPLSVGDDAYTGAGSVVTDDVPPGALAVARSQQVNIDDYAKRRKDGTGGGGASD
jgi:bifunctional UDP-N-acetylglucosamine pyrophosphorylase/glucosamine-1-phosphate N-acetyltransferase